MPIPRSTSREEMQAMLDGQGALGGERLLEYNIFLTDAFSGSMSSISFMMDAPGPPDQIDGYSNDDSYRRSRHLLNRRTDADATASESNSLRESSLARQIDEKANQPATIRLIRRLRPEELAAVKSSEPQMPWENLIPPNTKFFLEQVQENREEKVQIIDTFGQWIAFFFGARPEVYNYSGTLLNTSNHDWKNEFQENYQHFLRGSQAVQNQATMLLQYDDVLVEGYMLNCSVSMQGAADKAAPFSFNLLVMNRSPLNPRGIIGLRELRSGRISPAELALFNDMQQALDLTEKGKVDELETFLLMREYFSGHYVPGAGTAIHYPQSGKVTATVSTAPGQAGGLSDSNPATDRPIGVDFTPTQTNSLRTRGIDPASLA